MTLTQSLTLNTRLLLPFGCVVLTIAMAPLAANAQTPNNTGTPDIKEAAEELAVGAKTKKASAKKKKKDTVEFKIDRLRAETGWFVDNAAPNNVSWLHGAFSLNAQPSREWEFQLGARFDGHWQNGNPDSSRLRADYTENFIRWKTPEHRLTLGSQNILWGRTDEFPPSDRLSRVDLSRFILDPYAERRRAVPGVRFEKFLSDYKLDLVWIPDFQPAVLPQQESIWHPVDRNRGQIIGIAPTPELTYLIRNGSFAEEKKGQGGGGLRITRSGGKIDWGFSLQRARQSIPYYRLNPALRAPLLSGLGGAGALASIPGQAAFTAVHPLSTVYGVEAEFQAGGATWRMEGAYSGTNPATTLDLRYLTVPATDLVAGVEFFPGDSDTRFTLQLAGHWLKSEEVLLERKSFYAATGEIDHPFGKGRWRANVRFLSGINHRDLYVSPKLTYLGFEPHQIYIGAHFFSGDDRGLGGFHRNHDMAVLGWQVRY